MMHTFYHHARRIYTLMNGERGSRAIITIHIEPYETAGAGDCSASEEKVGREIFFL
jgi:hypothetical protein